MSRSEPESCQSVLTVDSSFAPRQQRPRSLLPDLKESFHSAVLGFWGSLNRRASKQPNSCIPLLTRRRVVRRTASWPRLTIGRREQSSPSAQPGSSVAGYRRSRSCPTLPSGYVDVTEPRSKYSSDIFKTARPTSLSGDAEEELHCVTPPAFKSMSPLYNSSPECYIDDDLSYLIEGIDELKGFLKRKQGDSWFDEQDGNGNSTVTTVSENKSAISSASQELLEPGVQGAGPRFKGIRQKDNKYIAEIRPSGSKRTVWLGTYATQEEAALAFDAGIFYYRVNIAYNFPDSPVVLPPVPQEPWEVSTTFVKTEARKNAERAWSSGARYSKPRIQSSSADSAAGSSTGSETFGKPRQYKSSLECYIDDDLSYLIEGIDELKGSRKRKQGDSWFDEQDGDGNSTVTTVSENKSAISSASQELLEPGVQGAGPRFKGIRQKDNKYIAEIRPSWSKKTVWLGTYATQEEAALAFDAGIFYFQKFAIPFNFPDSPKVLPAVRDKPQDVSVQFVKTQARRNAERAWSSGARYSKPRIQSSSAGSAAGSSTGSETFGKPGQYTLAEVLVATHKHAKQIGESPSGRVYWGKLETGQEVAVKVWAEGSHQVATEFHIFRRVCDLWREHHKYLVQLIGYCEEGGEQISIYEYMPGGSLQQHLHEKGMLNLETHALDWGTRLKIALKVAQGLQSLHAGNYFESFHENIQRYKVFFTEKNWVPKIHLHLGQTGMYDSSSELICIQNTKEDHVYCFGVLLLELICGRPLDKPRNVDRVNPLLEDFCNLEGIIDSTLGSNYHKESVAKVMKIANLSIDPQRHIQPTMHVLVNEILVALELEEGCMGKKDAVATNIHQSALKSDTSHPLEDALKEIVVERSTVDDLNFNCELVIVDSGGENRQQPETGNAEFHGSRSWKSQVEMSTAHDIVNLNPHPKFCDTTTSIEGGPNLPSVRGSIMVAGRKDNEGNLVELLFRDAENMAEVVGIGIDWAKVVVTKEMDVKVRQIGEGAWKDFWVNLDLKKAHEGFQLMNIILPEPDTQDSRPSQLVVEDLTERFGVGLTRGDVTGVYVQDHNDQVNDHEFFPLVLDLAKYMGLRGENVTKSRPVSNGEAGSSKGAAESRSSQEQSGGKNGPPQDPPQGPPQDPPQDACQDPPRDPPEPLPILPLDIEETKVLVVVIFPERGCVRQGRIAQVHSDDPINSATIAPILRFKFEVKGDHRKITTTLNTQCNLGEGGPKITPKDPGYFQDNITISLNCKRESAATLSSARVENVEVVKRTITHTDSRSSARGCSGQLGGPGQLLSLVGVQAEASYGGTTERSDSFAHEISTTQLGCFHVNPQELAGSLVYNFLYPPEVLDYIADGNHGPRELISVGIGRTFWPSIVGEWDNLDTSKKSKYSFKTKRDITSVAGLRRSHANREEPQSFQQSYEVPLWVNHAMTHIFHSHKIIELRGPGGRRLNHVIGTNPALHVDGT